MSTPLSFDNFISPFTWRFGSPAMRQLWSETQRRRLWRRLWVLLAETQVEFGLARAEQAADLRAHMNQINVEQAYALEQRLHSEMLAEAHVFAAQCPTGGELLHLDFACSEIHENAHVLCLREALGLIINWLRHLLEHLATQIETWAETPTVSFTHLQPAEPTTIGFRLARCGQDLLIDLRELLRLRDSLRGTRIRGVANKVILYAQVIQRQPLDAVAFQTRFSERINLQPFTIDGELYPRKQDWLIATTLGALANSLYKLAQDLRLLQVPYVGEYIDYSTSGQADIPLLPFRSRPGSTEQILTLGKLVAHMVSLTWDLVGNESLEYTGAHRISHQQIFPVMFLCLDEMLIVAQHLIRNMTIDLVAVQSNLDRYGAFATVPRLLIALLKAGADQQQMRTLLREYTLTARNTIADGGPNPLIDELSADDRIAHYLTGEQVRQLLSVTDYLGDLPIRARAYAQEIRRSILNSA